jgi:uncharacterized protein YoxC
MYLEISLIILGITCLILVIFCIPVLLQLGRAAKDITVTLETLNQRLPTILKSMEDITANINKSTATVNQGVQYFSSTINRFNNALGNIAYDVENIVPLLMRQPLYQKIRNIVAVVKGVRVFMEVMMAKER